MIEHDKYWNPTIIVKWEAEDIQAVMKELNMYPTTRFAVYSFMRLIEKHNPEITCGTIYETINEVKHNEYIKLNHEWLNEELVRQVLFDTNKQLYMEVADDIKFLDNFLKENGNFDINTEARKYIQLVTTGQFILWEDFLQFIESGVHPEAIEYKQTVYELMFNRFIDNGKNLDVELLKWLTEKSK